LLSFIQDTDKDGAIGFHELKVALRALGFDLKKSEVLKILRDHDRQGSGQMQFDDFAKVGELMVCPLLGGHIILTRLLLPQSTYFTAKNGIKTNRHYCIVVLQ